MHNFLKVSFDIFPLFILQTLPFLMTEYLLRMQILYTQLKLGLKMLTRKDQCALRASYLTYQALRSFSNNSAFNEGTPASNVQTPLLFEFYKDFFPGHNVEYRELNFHFALSHCPILLGVRVEILFNVGFGRFFFWMCNVMQFSIKVLGQVTLLNVHFY
jgi:hypothetical protein